jgi:hypothetical protein
MTKRDMIADFLSVKQLSNMSCEDGVLEAAARAVVLHEIGRNKEKRKKPRKKVFGRLMVQCFEPFNTLYD